MVVGVAVVVVPMIVEGDVQEDGDDLMICGVVRVAFGFTSDNDAESLIILSGQQQEVEVKEDKEVCTASGGGSGGCNANGATI